MIELKEQSAIASADADMAEFEIYAGLVCESQRGVNWWIGDFARMAERRWPNTWQQVFPVWVSPDLIARCKAVSAAYPPDQRNILATWTVHMTHAKKPDRLAIVQAHVDAGHTSDEARKNPPVSTAVKTDWLLCVDVNYYIHRYFHSGAGIEAASTFDGWLIRLIDRLKKKGLTDVVCCLDSRTNHRKKLTENWESPYKPRAEKDDELAGQLRLAPELLKKRNLPVVSIDDMEADDVMASYAVQFPGMVTLLTQDKDMRQCLTSKCNILLDVTWEENTETGASLPVYKWVKARWSDKENARWEAHPEDKPKNTTSHTDDGLTYSGTKVVGITPEQFAGFQAIAGDSTDGISGVSGIGAKGAMDLILAHGTVQGVIEAAQSGLIALTEKKRQAVLEFAPLADVMLKLTTLRTDLMNVPQITKLCLKESA